MTRKGSKQQPWTSNEVRYLAEHAGRIPLRDICHTLRRSNMSVKKMARRLSLSLRVPVWGLVWCDECACWRTTLNKDGQCRVCDMQNRLAGREAACADTLALMTIAQRSVYEESESKRASRRMLPRPKRAHTESMGYFEASKADRDWYVAIERWEYARLKLQYDAAKTRLRRMREVTGTNPRKKSK